MPSTCGKFLQSARLCACIRIEREDSKQEDNTQLDLQLEMLVRRLGFVGKFGLEMLDTFGNVDGSCIWKLASGSLNIRLSTCLHLGL